MRRTMKIFSFALLIAALSGGAAMLAVKGSARCGHYGRQVIVALLDAVASYAVERPAFQVQLRALQTQLDGVTRDGDNAAKLLRELTVRLRDRASQADPALLQNVIETLDARASGQAEQTDIYADRLATLRWRLSDEVKKVREEAVAARTEVAAVKDRLTRVRTEIAGMRAEVAAASQALRDHERRGELGAKQAPDDCYARLTAEQQRKVTQLAVEGFDRVKHGDPAAALEAFHTALAWDRSSPEILFGMSLAHIQRGDVAAAERAVRLAIEAEHSRKPAPWLKQVMVGIQGQHRLAFEAMKTDPTLHSRLAQSPR